MEIKSNKKNINYNNEKEAIPIQIQEIKTLYQCNTLKNFNKSKNIQNIIEEKEQNEYDNNNLLTSLKQIYDLNRKSNHKKSLSIRYSANNISPKNSYINNQNKNTNLNNDNSSKNMKRMDNNKFSLSSMKKENDDLSKNSKFNHNINNKFEKDNLMNNLNNIVTENKKKIKQNQGKINNLINVIKNQEINKNRRINEESDNYDMNNGSQTQVFRYIKKIPQKSNDSSTKIRDVKKDFLQNLKQSKMKRQNTNNNNLIINGLNQIYKKTLL